MDVLEELERLGGVATRGTLIGLTSRREVDRALSCGDVIAVARGRYALPLADEARAAAHGLSGVVCLTSAALVHGWAVKLAPERPQVAVPRGRKVSAARAAKVDPHHYRLGVDDVIDGVTSPDRTLLDCLRDLPFDEALAVADSALRSGYSHARMRAVVRDARGPDVLRMRQIVEHATPEAANPFESALRAIALRVTGLRVRPQISLHTKQGSLGRPDLVDEDLRIVLEADSFEWHGERAALRSDCLRYNAFVVNGWLVLRFAWEDVMFEPPLIQATLELAVAERTEMVCPRCRSDS